MGFVVRPSGWVLVHERTSPMPLHFPGGDSSSSDRMLGTGADYRPLLIPVDRIDLVSVARRDSSRVPGGYETTIVDANGHAWDVFEDVHTVSLAIALASSEAKR